MNVTAYGISADIPEHWEARLFRHPEGEPTLHVASFTLPSSDGDFGSHATARMPREGLFMSLTEYRVGHRLSAQHGLFAHPRPRLLEERAFRSHTLLRPRPGQRGTQRFFSESGRAFCLYVVLAGPTGPNGLRDLNHLLSSLDIGAAK